MSSSGIVQAKLDGPDINWLINKSRKLITHPYIPAKTHSPSARRKNVIIY